MRQALALCAAVALAGGTIAVADATDPAGAAGPPGLTVGDVRIVEGNAGTQIAFVPVTLTEPSANDVTATFSLTAGSADTPTDWIPASTTTSVLIRTGAVAATVKVKVVADIAPEADEDLTVTVTGFTGDATLVDAVGDLTILDDDSLPAVGISVGDVTLDEGDTKVRSAKLPITLSAPAAGDTSVTLSLGGNAVRLSDHKFPAPKSILIRAGKSSAIATVPVLGDLLAELTETVVITATSGPIPTARAGTVTIRSEASDAGARVASAPGDLTFYTPPTGAGSGPPGELVWSRVAVSSPTYTGYLVMYRSTSQRGKPIFVTGKVFVPTAPAPPGGREVVAWAEGTTGMIDNCAPSRIYFSAPALTDLIAAGHVVVGTDFEGLGTPGPHAYLQSRSEAQTVLDSVRVVAELGVSTTGRAVVYGGSRGGHAAIATAERQPGYAPEIELLGVIGLGAGVVEPTDTNQVDPLILSSYRAFLMMSLRGTQQVFGPSSAAVVSMLDHYLTSAGKAELLNADGCNSPVIPHFAAIPAATLFKLSRPALPPSVDVLRQHGTVGAIGTAVPIVLMSGLSDPIVTPAMIDGWHAWACAGNGAIEKRWYSGGHFPVPTTDIVNWVGDRFAGLPPGDSCP